MHAILLAVALGASALSNFPREAGGKVSHPAIGVTLGGAPAVVVPAGELLTAFRADGSTPSGFPVSLGAEESAAGGAAAADMDGDGRPEIAVVTTGGKLFLWSGSVLPGFPVQLGGRARAGVSFGDVDGDGRPELLVGDDRGRIHAFKRNGLEARGFPLNVGRPVTSTISVSNFAGGRSLAVGCDDGRVHVLDPGGRERPGFPLVTHFSVTGAPVFVDLDDDGEMDLLVASQDFNLYAVDAKGAALPGFPVAAKYRLYEGPAVADLDGDGRLDVVFASADGTVYAVDRTGVTLPGFPVRAGGRLFGGPAIGDLDRDGGLDVVVASADGTLYAFSHTGKPLTGFPAALGGIGEVTASPLLYDLAQDGTLSAFVGLPGGDLQALRAPRLGTATALAPWPAPGRDPGHGGRFGPNPPTYKALKLEPGQPRVADALKASWRAIWLDAAGNEAIPTPRIQWLRDGKPVAALDGRRELPAGTARRGETWRFVLTGPGGGSVEGPSVRVLDTAPGAPQVAIEPAEPGRAAPARVVVTRQAVDADGDALQYRIRWLLDGVDTGVQGETFPGDRMRKGALLTARVVASDGELEGPAGLAQARVADTRPGPLAIALEPPQPRRADPVRTRVTQSATDADGDPLTYRYRWSVAGKPLNLALEAAELPAGLARKHQVVAVEAVAFDGAKEGPPAAAELEVRNTPPTAPQVVILPARPRKGDALRAVLVAPAQDPDQDPITYRYAWRKNGGPVPVSADGREVAGSEVARGDRFEVTVVANDGEADGPPATATVQAVNTPPTPPRIAITPRWPRGGEPLKVVIEEPAKDRDGDPVSLLIAWSREGRSINATGDALPAAEFRKHERIRVVVTPHDAEEAGEPVAFEVAVEDAPPTAPVVGFSSERPTVAAPLAAVIRTPARDPDGDAIRYRYRWLRDGTPVALSDGSAASAQPPYWTAASEVPAGQLKKGQRWEVEVQAGDGELFGPVARAAAIIANSPPPAPRLAFVPVRPRRVDGLALSIQQPPDPDGDLLTYRYAWTRNGAPYAAPPDQAQIPRDLPRKGERWAVQVIASDGEADSPPARLETVIADTAPGATGVALCDGPVPAGTVLEARLTSTSTDADGDPVGYRYAWQVNGRSVSSAAGQTRLAAPSLRKHDLVRVEVTPTDGELAGPIAAAECAVDNTPPGAPTVALEPAEPSARSGVQLVVRKPSQDRDGDAVTYRINWFRNGLPAPYEGAYIPAGVLHHGELWTAEVTPFDGEDAGQPVVASAVVKNTPPAIPSVLLQPEAPTVGQALACDVQVPQRDVDQEPISVRYRWYRNDRLEPLSEGSPAIPEGVVRRGERWRCEAWANDGFADSPRAVAEVTIRNSPPSAPAVVIEPERPRKTDDLLCRVATLSADPDGDPVSYAYAWWRNERPMPAGPEPARMEASRIAKGDRWRCAVTPSDGTAAGPAGSGERLVLNSPPGPARIRLEPEAPRAGQVIRCMISGKSEDVDGDAVRYRFAWLRDGVQQPFAESAQEVPQRLVKAGDRWRCQVTPTDGSDDGPASGSEEALVLPSGEDAAALRAP